MEAVIHLSDTNTFLKKVFPLATFPSGHGKSQCNIICGNQREIFLVIVHTANSTISAWPGVASLKSPLL